MKREILYKVIAVVLSMVGLASCSSTKFVPEGNYLLDKNVVHINSESVKSADMKKMVRQQPNTKILGAVRFHLGLYNLSGKGSNRKLSRWLRSIGEPPVVFDSIAHKRSIMQMEQSLENMGFYNAVILDSLEVRRKKVRAHYMIDTYEPYRIKNISYFSNDKKHVYKGMTDMEHLILADTALSHIKPGVPLDVEQLDKERERIVTLLKTQGYFNFSKRYVQFYADTLGRSKNVNLLLFIVKEGVDDIAFKPYKIDSITVDLDYAPVKEIMSNIGSFSPNSRTKVFYRGKLKIDPKLILESIQFEPDELYDVEKVNLSYERIHSLGLFKYTNIHFTPSVSDSTKLVCEIKLTPSKRQSYNIFLEGTNNSGNIGVGGNLSFTHKNLFKGGENLTFDIWGALKKEQLANKSFFSTTEFGAELKLVTPQFWVPFLRLSEFRKRYAPKSLVALSYSNELTPFYNRSIVNGRFGYMWAQREKQWRYELDIFDLNYVLMSDVDQAFINGLQSQSIKSAYTSHMMLSANFGATYTNQRRTSRLSYSYLRTNIETSGNVLQGVSSLFGNKTVDENGDGYYELFDVRFAQFVKADAEYRYNQYINKANTLVYRFFVGLGYPYGNMGVLPFEEAYFCGGANGIRAWNSKTLGPGSFNNENLYPNSVGDFKLEANIEYRFKLFWLLEGALFLDAGNIWNINKLESRPETKLTSSFYKQIAIGTGMGIRLDVNFFLLRFDLGLKMVDPAQPDRERFVLFNENGGFNQSVFNIAIGYPF